MVLDSVGCKLGGFVKVHSLKHDSNTKVRLMSITVGDIGCIIHSGILDPEDTRGFVCKSAGAAVTSDNI